MPWHSGPGQADGHSTVTLLQDIDSGLNKVGRIRRTELHNWVPVRKSNVEQCSIKRVAYQAITDLCVLIAICSLQEAMKPLITVKLADICNMSRIKPCCSYAAARENGSDQVSDNP